MAVAPPPCTNLPSFLISDPHQSLFYHQVLSAGTSIDNNGAVTMAGQSLFTNNSNSNNYGADSTPNNNFGSQSSGACCWGQLQPSCASTITTTTTTTVTSGTSTQPFFSLHPLSGSHVNPLNQISSPTHGNPQLVYPTDEDILLGGETSEFQQQLASCTPVMHPNLVSTLKNMVQPAAPLGCYSPLQHFIDQQQHSDSLGLGTLFSAFQGQCHQQLVTSELQIMDTVASGVTNPTSVFDSQPLPLASLPPSDHPQAELQKVETKVELKVDEDVEADVVPVALIQNRRPFRCGHEGCAKTFKNPQTMKMHHKTHYTDGSAANRGGLMTLPTLTSSLKAGQNKKIPSRCPKCKKTFVGLYELRRHYGRKHSEGEKPFGCRKCGKKFYIEVDVRDHEKLCGEPIECKCGLKFAFKCNLVAHKKAHPACQDQSLNVSNNSSTNASTTNSTSNNNHQLVQRPTFSDNSNSTQTKGSTSNITTSRGSNSKRQRLESDSALSPMPTNNLHKGISNRDSNDNNHHHRDLKHHHRNNIVPEVPEFKALKYDFSGLQFTTEGTSMWGCNMHYPMTTMMYNVGGDIGHQSSSSLFSTKVPQAPFFETFNPADLNQSSSEANLKSPNLRAGNPVPGMGIVHLR